MAQKRMFDRAIIDTDRFMDLGMTAKALYFLLGMEADDEGFVSYKKVMRIHGGNEDDMKMLVAKGFIIHFPSGVVVITDWNTNNYLDKNRLKQTEYQIEKAMLTLTPNNKYELNIGSTRGVERSGEEKATNVAILAPLEVREVQTDSEGNEKSPKVKRVADPAWALKEKLYKMLEAETGVPPTPHAGDYQRVKAALVDLTEDGIIDMFENALAAKEVHTVREVFTAREIDIYRQENL